MRKNTNRFSSQMYKKGGEKQDWISNKIATLLEEDPNMPQKQAISIALSMVEKQFANGGDYSFNSTPNFGSIEKPKVQGFGYDPNFQSQISPTSITAGEDFKKDNPLPQGTFQADPFGVSANKELEKPEKKENFQSMQFFNPYAGVDLAQGANALGQSIENGDALGIIAGGAKVLTGTARNIFGGMGQANIRNEGMKNYYDAQRDNIVGKSQQGQNGGVFPNFQDGGEQQGQAEQIYQMVAEALQSGADPQEIAQQLLQSGIPEEQVMQIIQEVMSQMQQSPQEEQIEGNMSNPQEEAIEMKMGGSFDQLIGKKILGYEYNKDKDTYSVRYE